MTRRTGYQTLRNLAWVARSFETSRRRDSLSFAHHAEVAALPQAEQELWLNRAERLGWSRNELRRQLAPRHRRDRACGPTVVRVQLTADREQRWREAATARKQELMEWMALTLDAAADAVLTGPSAPAASTWRPAPSRPRLRSVG